jgi:hypothetical protein
MSAHSTVAIQSLTHRVLVSDCALFTIYSVYYELTGEPTLTCLTGPAPGPTPATPAPTPAPGTLVYNLQLVIDI